MKKWSKLLRILTRLRMALLWNIIGTRHSTNSRYASCLLVTLVHTFIRFPAPLTKLYIHRELTLTFRRNFDRDGLLVSYLVPVKLFSEIRLEKVLKYPELNSSNSTPRFVVFFIWVVQERISIISWTIWIRAVADKVHRWMYSNPGPVLWIIWSCMKVSPVCLVVTSSLYIDLNWYTVGTAHVRRSRSWYYSSSEIFIFFYFYFYFCILFILLCGEPYVRE